MPVALLITVIGRVIIQLGRLTDWSVNELTRRGPVRELESPVRTRRAGAVATSAATAGARAAPAASTGGAAGHTRCLSSAERSTTVILRTADGLGVFSLVAICWRPTRLMPPAELSLLVLISERDDAPSCQHYANYLPY